MISFARLESERLNNGPDQRPNLEKRDPSLDRFIKFQKENICAKDPLARDLGFQKPIDPHHD